MIMYLDEDRTRGLLRWDQLIAAMEDNAVQDIAWAKYGFRSGTRVLKQAFQGVTVPPTQAIKKTQAPGYAVTKLLLDCFVNNNC